MARRLISSATATTAPTVRARRASFGRVADFSLIHAAEKA